MTSMPTQTIILIAPEFNEESVVLCLCQMRQRGIAVDLVGVPANLVTGASGLVVHPDYSLAQLQQTMTDDYKNLLIIPGNDSCAASLLSDPRVHRTIKHTFADNGIVATTSSIVPHILANIGLLEPSIASRFLAQDTQGASDFISSLINHIAT